MLDTYLLFQIAKHSYKLHIKLLQSSYLYYKYYLKYKESIDDHFQQIYVFYGRIEYRVGGKLSAIIYDDGTRMWYKYGKLHRDNDLPAVILNDGRQGWYKNGEQNRDHGLPVSIHHDGTYEWYTNGKLHRGNDLPAVIHADGAREWYENGWHCRDDYLPATIDYDGYIS